MTAQSTYVLGGTTLQNANREDLGDIIYDVSPYETPFLSAITKKQAKNTLHEWLTDTLAAPDGSNAAVEGADIGVPDDDPTVRVNNYTQIFTKEAIVTGTQEDGMDPAGMASAMADQVKKKMREIKTDWESSAIGLNQIKVAGDVSTARRMGSMTTYLSSNTTFAGDGADPTGVGSDAGTTTRTDGTPAAFTEDMLTDALQQCYDNGAEPTLLFCGSFNKRVISTFTGGGTHFVDKDNKRLVNSVDVYIGDWHTLKVVPSRHIRQRDALLIDPEYVACSDLRSLTTIDIGITGDNYKKMMVWESTLQVSNEQGNGGIFDLTTS